jgi:hypothetical protein
MTLQILFLNVIHSFLNLHCFHHIIHRSNRVDQDAFILIHKVTMLNLIDKNLYALNFQISQCEEIFRYSLPTYTKLTLTHHC